MSPELKWIEPLGGLGDALLLSSVLKLAHDRRGAKYNMVRRTRCAELFAGHPAIERTGFLPAGAKTLCTAYWHRPEMEDGSVPRAFQMLAKMFGLELPVPERMYLPLDGVSDAELAAMIPWKGKNVAIAPDSVSPRKTMSREKWGRVARSLSDYGALVVQFGEAGAKKVRGAYSLAGLTAPKEAVLLLRRMDLLITSDNFLMHAARLSGTPTVSLWGPTESAGFGYPEHRKLVARCGLGEARCVRNTIGSERTALYLSVCGAPVTCMDSLNEAEILRLAREELAGRGPAAEGGADHAG